MKGISKGNFCRSRSESQHGPYNSMQGRVNVLERWQALCSQGKEKKSHVMHVLAKAILLGSRLQRYPSLSTLLDSYGSDTHNAISYAVCCIDFLWWCYKLCLRHFLKGYPKYSHTHIHTYTLVYTHMETYSLPFYM